MLRGHVEKVQAIRTVNPIAPGGYPNVGTMAYNPADVSGWPGAIPMFLKINHHGAVIPGVEYRESIP
jgi:hypothetical protein